MKKLFSSFLLCLILSGCGSSPSKNIPQYFDAKEPQGLIVGTIAIKNEKPIYNRYHLHYGIKGQVDNKDQERMITINSDVTVFPKLKPDFFEGDKAVYYFAVKESVGKYAFSYFSLFYNDGYMQSTEKINVEGVSFISVPGKITYVGQIELDYRNQVIKLVDKSERDLPNLKEKYSNIDWKQLINVEQ